MTGTTPTSEDNRAVVLVLTRLTSTLEPHLAECAPTRPTRLSTASALTSFQPCERGSALLAAVGTRPPSQRAAAEDPHVRKRSASQPQQEGLLV